MKNTVRKLLSLVMVFAMLFTMIPGALAVTAEDFDWDEIDLDDYEDYDDIVWDYDDVCEDTDDDHDWDYMDEDEWEEPDCEYEGYIYVECEDCGEEGYFEVDTLDHDWIYELDEDNEDYHYMECDWCGEEDYEKHDKYCDCDVDSDDDEDDGEYVTIEDDHQYIKLTLDDDTDEGVYELDDNGVEISVAAEWTGDGSVSFEFDWDGDIEGTPATSGNTSVVEVDTSGSDAEISCTITTTKKFSDGKPRSETVTWNLTAEAAIKAEVVVYNDSEGYLLGDMDEEGNDSVEQQLYDALLDEDDDYELEYVKFSAVKASGKGELDAKKNTKYYVIDAYEDDADDLLSEVEFVPDEEFEGTLIFAVTIGYYDGNKLKTTSGTISIEVKKAGATGLGIVLTAESGDEIEIDEDLFHDFWEEAYPDGELEKVKFDGVSAGTLYYDYDGDDETKLNTKTCYVDPTSKQIGLDALTYVPAKKTTTATIEFTATGDNEKGKSKTASGTITILYVEGDVEPIVYESTGDNITLDADDFTDLYKEVMDVSKASSLQIQFLEAPVNGTLYLNYKVSSAGKVTGTALTAKNIANFKFGTSKSAARAIEDLTYVPGTKASGDTIEFACYSGNALKFLGTVEFGKADPVELTKISSTNGVAFTVADFFGASNTDLQMASYINFGAPSSGTLYVNYNGTSGTKVTSGMKFSAFEAASLGYYNISNVTYVPAKSGTATVPFTATTYNGKTVQGTVTITTVVNRFPDLKSDHWAFDHIMKLVGMGVVGGDDKGNVNPGGDITYGEVLKIVMKAAGYADQKATGTHWASGYLTKAVADDLISANTDLNAKADRNAVATLTGKALKLAQASSVKAGIAAPIDSNNGYVYALYNAGILTGSNVNGVNYFKGGDTITRAEAFTIVSRVYDYTK